jgi:hypothetical protein
MATTRSSPKPKANPAPKANGKAKTPRSAFAKGGQKKPENLRQWFGYHLSKRADKRGWTRAVRGVHRKGVTQAERARERKNAHREMRPSAYPTRSELRQKRKLDQHAAGAGTGRATVSCGGCGTVLDERAARSHHCASSADEAKRVEKKREAWKARAGYGTPAPAASAPTATTAAPAAKPAASPTVAPTGGVDDLKKWRWERKAWRRDNMTRTARAWDTVQRYDSRFAGDGAKCATCHTTLHADEIAGHKCGITAYTHPAYQAPSSPATASTPPTAPAAAPTPSKAPTNGGSPAMAWGSKSGNGSTGGGTTTSSGGSGNSAAHAGTVLQAMQAWSQDIPKTHGEMLGMLAAMNQMCVGIGDTVRQFQNNLVNMGTDAEGNAKGFHPSCVQQLNGVADTIAGAGAGFTATGVAITQHYQALIDHYAGGTPSPGRNYLSQAS